MSDAAAAQLAGTIASKLGQSLAKAFVNAITGADISPAKLEAFWDNLDPADAVIQVIDGAIFGNVMEELVYDVVVPAAVKAKWEGIAIAKLGLVLGEKAGKSGGDLKSVFANLITNYEVNGKLCLPRQNPCYCKSDPGMAISATQAAAKCKASTGVSATGVSATGGGNTGMFLLAAAVFLAAVN